MKQLLSLILFSLSVSSCSQNIRSGLSNNIRLQKVDSAPNKVQNTKQVTDTSFSVVIDDSSDYSKSFIKSIKPDSHHRKYYLSKNRLIVNSTDTYYFPKVPPFGKKLYLSNKKGNIEINLTIRRILESTIEFEIKILDGNKAPTIKSGTADLSPTFYYGTEIDDDDKNDLGYSSIEYWAQSAISGSIRIGLDPNNGKSFLVKLKCQIGSYGINLDNFPNLRENK